MSKKSLSEKLRCCLEYHAVDGKLEVEQIVALMESQLETAYKRGYGKGVNDTEVKMTQSRKMLALKAGLTKTKGPRYLREAVNQLGYRSVTVQQMLREE